MSSAADTTRQTKVKKGINYFKVAWETFKSFENLYMFSGFFLTLVCCVSAAGAIAHLTGYLLAIITVTEVVAFFDPTHVQGIIHISLWSH